MFCLAKKTVHFMHAIPLSSVFSVVDFLHCEHSHSDFSFWDLGYNWCGTGFFGASQFVFVQSGFLHFLHVLHPGFVQTGLLQSSHLVTMSLFKFLCFMVCSKLDLLWSPQMAQIIVDEIAHSLHRQVLSVSADVGQYSWAIVIRFFTHDVSLHLGSPHFVQV